ncbi:restriction endonuclease [Desulfovibrio sp. OttesenSCG-928-A18]|nr:restriction endonuclease [Desulfovibrio sp. OttesenSCG-928-A18]
MEFTDAVKAHSRRVEEHKAHALTEEATKMALIVPFLQLLGYDPINPRVVIPEYCADFGGKKECKVDYAIKRGDDIVVIIEAKKVGDPLDGAREGQLQQYFQSLLPVKIAILTDGVVYKFYTDLDNPNVMDKKPFMIFDFLDMDEAMIPELKKLCNDCFDLDTALSAAQELKYLGQLKKIVSSELENPSDDLVRLFARQVYDGLLRANIIDDFRPRIKLSFENHINSVLNARLQGAMLLNAYPGVQPETTGEECATEAPERENRIITTQEEIEGYHIVRAIMSKVVNPDRVIMRDTISYCGILLDNKNTKPICRMHFNAASVKYLETFDAEKNGTKHKLDRLSDIYKYSTELRAVIGYYDKRE